jgi:hypothetical protein
MLLSGIQTLKYGYSSQFIGKVHPHFTYEARKVNLGCAFPELGHFLVSRSAKPPWRGKKGGVVCNNGEHSELPNP